LKSQITREQWVKYIFTINTKFNNLEYNSDHFKEQQIFQSYFGNNEPLANCINRAYRDFNRTLHGYGSLPNKEETTKKIKFILKNEFEEMKNRDIDNQEKFDSWHQNTCLLLIEFYKQNNFKSFHIGQAQKWINMILKYIFSYGNKYLCGYDNIYQFCHVPLDNILIDELKIYNPPKLKMAWSRIDNYKVYSEYQDWFRQKFINLPLDVEFKLWLGEGL